MRSSINLLVANLLVAEAATVTFYWNTTWVWAQPDGFGRPVIGINGTWPPPPISVNLNDQIVVQLTNGLGNETTALHFHGQNQGKSAQMEGAAGVSQCPLPPGLSMTYNFTAKNTGTHWYHAHLGGSYLDGFRGPLIVHDPSAPYINNFDQEIIMTVSDWYHTQTPYLLNYYQTQPKSDRGVEPTPDSTLINDSQNVKFSFTPGKRYLFRIISMSGFASNIIKFEGHNMTIVEMDGTATVPVNVSKIMIAAAQRYNVIVTALPSATKNYGILSAMMPNMFSGDPMNSDANMNATAYMIYNTSVTLPPQPMIQHFRGKDEFTILPFDQQAILGPVTQNVAVDFNFKMLNSMTRGTVNGQSYVPQIVPTLYTALSAPAGNVTDPTIYGVASNTVILPNPLGIVEIVLNNLDTGSHPFHIHGHVAQIVAQGAPGTKANQVVFNGTYTSLPPARRDVFMVYRNSYTIIRFKTGNPGVWLLHCHIEWHIEAGLVLTFVEDPIQLQQQNLTIPQNMLSACTAQGIPYVGNAAGNSGNKWYDLRKAPMKANPNPWGALINPPAVNPYSKRRNVFGRVLTTWVM